MKKIVKYISFVFLSFTLFGLKVSAGTLNIYASSQSVTVGSTVIITVKTPDVAGNFSVTSSNSSVLSGGTSSTWIEGTITFSFKANNSGSSTITVRPIDAADYSGNVFSTSKSVTVTVNPKKVIVLSTDNSLSNLGVEGKEITPAFNKDTLEYSVELEPETTKINVTASASNSGASIVGLGERQVTDGDNNLEIVVTAENGTTRTYKIKATVKEYNPVIVKVDGKDYTVVRKKSSLIAPNNYKESTVKINNEDVPAFTSEITKYTLVALKDEKGIQNFYIYDKGSYKLYKEFKFNNIVLYPMELKKVPSGYFKTTINYSKEKITAYKIDKDSDYSLIYGMNVETGKINTYTYDSKENTVQIYDDEYIKKISKETELYLKILIGLSVGLVLSIGTIVFIIIKNKKKIRHEKIKDIH